MSDSIGLPFASIFQELEDGACVTDPQRRLVYMNPAAERLLGVSRKSLGESEFCDLLCGHLTSAGRSDSKAGCVLLDELRLERAVTFSGSYESPPAFEWREFRVSRMPAKSKKLRVRCMSMSGEAQGYHLTLIEDADREAEFEQQKEDWRSMAAHDLRAPLNSVVSALSAVHGLPEGAPLDAASREMISIALQSCRRMGELVRTYLDLAKFDAGRMPVVLADVDLSALAARCVREQAAFAAERRVAVRVSVPEALRVRGDYQLLFRVIENILNNALKYGAEGGEAVVSARAEGAQIVLEIQDRGPGIEPEDLPRIFDRYYQAQIRRAGHLLGTGLGLAFCSEAMKAMGGDISAASKVGEGSIFSLRLPPAP